MGYFWAEEMGLINHPELTVANTEAEALEFMDFRDNGIKEAKRIVLNSNEEVVA